MRIETRTFVFRHVISAGVPPGSSGGGGTTRRGAARNGAAVSPTSDWELLAHVSTSCDDVNKWRKFSPHSHFISVLPLAGYYRRLLCPVSTRPSRLRRRRWGPRQWSSSLSYPVDSCNIINMASSMYKLVQTINSTKFRTEPFEDYYDVFEEIGRWESAIGMSLRLPLAHLVTTSRFSHTFWLIITRMKSPGLNRST